MTTWSAAKGLAAFLRVAENGADGGVRIGVRGRRCLELGAGTGVAGRCLGTLGAASVLMTDSEPAVLDALRSVCAEAAPPSALSCERLDWAETSTWPSATFDLVVVRRTIIAGVWAAFFQRSQR